MMKNITQVSPGNRVDFSKIRKASKGIKIPKFQNPYQGLTLTQGEYDTRKNVYGAKDDFFTNGQYDFAKMYEYYKAHPEQFKDLSLITATPTWEGAQRNTTGFGDWNSQFNNTGLNYFFGYDPNKADYFGPTTSARKAFLDYIAQQESQSSVQPAEQSVVQSEPDVTQLSTLTGDQTINTYTPDEYTAPFNFKPQPFTSPITNGIIAGLGLAANKHVYDNEMQKKVPLLEAPYHQYITGDYKTTVDAYNQVAADIQTSANRIASQSANLEANQAMQFAGAKSAADKRLEGALKQQEGHNFDRGKSLETSYFNNDSATNIANQNRTNLIADYNRRKDAKSKYQLQRNAIWADNWMKNRTDFGQWKANEENEYDASLSAYNKYLAELDLQEAKKPYQNLLSDQSKSNAFEQTYQNALRDWNSNLGNNDYWKGKEDLKEMWKLANRDDAKQRQGFLTYLQTHGDSDYGKQFTQGYNSELTEAKNKYIQTANGIQLALQSLEPTFRNTYTTEGFWNPRRLGGQYHRIFKDGGILKMKRGSRFVDYLEHNRKALKDQKQTTMENVKQAQKTLQKQLDAIDRETLILLRSIFK